MEFVSKEQAEMNDVNVVSLFGRTIETEIMNDPIADLIQEGQLDDFDLMTETPKNIAPRKVVNLNQFPDQSMFVLEEQLQSLRSNLNRIKFYLGDLEDLIPR